MYETELARSVKLVGERMLFQDFAEGKPAPGDEYLFATVAAYSPDRFELTLATREEHARGLTLLLHGSEKLANSDSAVTDLVAELANTVAGTLARSLSNEAHIDIATPVSGRGRLPGEKSNYLAFTSDEFELVVTLAPPR